MPLTDVKIKNADCAQAPRKLFGGGGLCLHLAPSGSKLWRMKYRYGSKEKLLSFGSYPEVSLKEARDRRDEARSHLRNDSDPAQIKHDVRRQLEFDTKNSFAAIAEEYLEKVRKEGKAEITLSKLVWLIDIVRHSFGNRPIKKISAQDILLTPPHLSITGVNRPG